MKKVLLKILSIVLTIGIGLPLVLFVLIYNGFFGKIPSDEAIENIRNIQSSIVYDSRGEILGKYYLQDRTEVSLDRISPFLIDALIATEDRRFYDHKGIDARSLARVLVKSLILQESAGGGSTITLQLAKNLFPRQPFKFLYYPINKTKEGIIAYRIEQAYSKDQILTMYLNTVSFGEDVYGVESASQKFFNRSAAELRPEQAATLVGMLKATTSYNPVLHPDASLGRRTVVLRQMVNNESLTEEEFTTINNESLGLDYQPRSDLASPYFLAQVKQKLELFLADHNKKSDQPLNLLTDGLKIYTTIDNGLQEYAEQAMQEQMQSLQKKFDKHWYDLSLWSKHQDLLNREVKKVANGRTPLEMQKRRDMYVYDIVEPRFKELSPIDSIKYYLQQLQAGFMAMDPSSGAIRSWVGGIQYQFFPYDHVMEDAKRQVGSTFKPIVYAAALENGISPCNYFDADQASYTIKDGEWKPANDNASYGGKYSMEGALEESVNTVSVKILNEVGIDKTITLAHEMGISSSIPEVPSIALGTPSISVQEMVTAYCSFVNGGKETNPYTIERIEDNAGNVLYQHKASSFKQVLSPKTSRMMASLLEGVVDDGTARSLRTTYKLNNRIGGKTGTTQNNADGWFMAITPQLVTGTWVGGIYPEISFQDTRLGQGATMALPIFAKFYSKLNKDPSYNYITKAQFLPIKDIWKAELDCDPFKEDFRLFDWLFGGSDKEDKKRTSTENADDKSFMKKLGNIFKKKEKQDEEN